ncbi:hypothetical protein JHE03_24305 [Pluralibacter gergoviae]|uniref:hypothetical protein n=1 Tax=Pluralibacter gergoviae TaxID=61647 RepID=UPI00190CCF53|nr:hypothetical protein [Pluralibacter gergoviae]ELC3075084.1 hypothetical protein [Pluralibacter gergoviae]MBK4119402.1 hypothetical protein [Pluralibacter gergoviae]
MNEKELLAELLRMHKADESLSRDFATKNYQGLKNLWEQGLSSYQVTKMTAGNIRIRRVHLGVLTPAGFEKANALN